jgi:acyl-CoA reductase-like NAD-dependent aldehyde dehydrogenase
MTRFQGVVDCWRSIELMTLPAQQHFIAGSWYAAPALEGAWICDANTRAPLQPHAGASADMIELALASAQDCHSKNDWARDHLGRADALERIAAYLSDPARLEAIALADSLTTGVVIGVSRRLTNMLPYLFTGAAQVIRDGYLSETSQGPRGPVEHFRRPWGPALLISPWNGPTPIGAHKLASALAAGAPALVKPSSWTPHSALAMFEAIAACDLPDGAASLILGDRHVIAPMLNDSRVRAVSFTGGLSGGRAVMAACANDFKPAQLELGGNNALVVLEGADIDAAATAIVFGLGNLNGQWCRALGRVIVARPLKTALIDAVMDKLAAVSLGSSMDEVSQMGPQAHKRQFDDVHRAIEALTDKGATVLSTTKMPRLDGYFVAPTLLDGCDPSDTLHEIFGPVAAIHGFDTEAEALGLANGPPFGLAGYVFGPEDAALAFAREMQTGGVKVNGYSLMALNGDFPRGAWKLSGLGEEGRRETVRFFTGARVVGVSPQDPLGI